MSSANTAQYFKLAWTEWLKILGMLSLHGVAVISYVVITREKTEQNARAIISEAEERKSADMALGASLNQTAENLRQTSIELGRLSGRIDRQ